MDEPEVDEAVSAGLVTRVGSATQRVSNGDAEWLRELYGSYRDNVYRYVLVQVANPATAEDFVSETFLRAAKNARRLRTWEESVLPWLFRVARNIILDDKRSCYTRKSVFIDHLPELPNESDGPDERFLRNWLVGEVKQCFQLLNDAQRRCLQLRFGDELSVSDTAALMNKSTAAVKQLQHRAIDKLGGLLVGTTGVAELAEVA